MVKKFEFGGESRKTNKQKCGTDQGEGEAGLLY